MTQSPEIRMSKFMLFANDSYEKGNVPRRGGIVVLGVVVFLVMVTLSLKIKTPGIAASRPLHYAGIGILFFYSVRVFPAFQRRLGSLSRYGWMLLVWYALLYVSVFLHTLGEPVRSIKDFLTGAIIDFGLLTVLLGGSGKGVRNEPYSTGLCRTFVCYAFLSLVLAWFMYYGLELSIGELRIGHNAAWGARLHGIQGEPTHLGAVMGLGIISGLFLHQRLAQGAKQIFSLMLLALMGATMFAAGSRNSILAVFIALGLMMVFSRFRLRLMIGIVSSLCGGLLAMLLLVNVAGNQFQSGLVKVEQAYEKEHSQTQLDKPEERSEGIRHLRTAFRLDESSATSERADRILNVMAKYLGAQLSNKLLGLGYGALEYGIVATSFNSYIDTIVRFGMIHLILLLLFLAMLAFRLYQCVRTNLTEPDLALFGMVVLGYAVTFSLNMSTLYAVFFHVGTFCFTIALVVAIRCDSAMNIKDDSSLCDNCGTIHKTLCD